MADRSTPLVLALCASLLASAARADVVRDGSLGADEPLGGDATTFVIEERHGARSGSNLFHSFLDFDLEANETAIFRGSSSIEQVISRVTGGPSEIAGLIRSDIPGASLFLINPDGITFASSARLDVGGSFHATTADYLELGFDPSQRFFADPGRQSALAPVDVSAFGFLDDHPAGIDVLDSELIVDRAELSLVAGDVEIVNGLVSATDGLVRLATVGSAGALRLSGPDGPDTPALGGRVSIREGSLIDGGAGIAGGRVQIRGGDLDVAHSSIASGGDGAGGSVDVRLGGTLWLRDESVIDAAPLVLGGTVAGRIGIVAREAQLRESVLLVGGDRAGAESGVRLEAEGDVRLEGPIASAIVGITLEGDGPSIQIESRTGSILLDGSQIRSESRGGTQAGAITLRAGGDLTLQNGAWILSDGAVPGTRAGPIDLRGDTVLVDASMVFARSGADLRGGEIRIEASRVHLTNGSDVINSGDGVLNGSAGGNIVILAPEEVRIDGRISPRASGVQTLVSATSPGGKEAGEIRIETSSLIVDDGGLISGGTVGQGPGGDITLIVDELVLRDGGGIDASTPALGSGGDVRIEASRSVTLVGNGLGEEGVGLPTRISTATTADGDAGSLSIVAPEVKLLEGAIISGFSGAAAGAAGELRISADRVSVLSGSLIDASSSLDDSAAPGTIRIDASESLRVADGGLVSTEALGGARGGTIEIAAPDVRIENGGAIASTSTGSGGAGSISIRAARALTLDRGRILSDGRTADAGSIRIGAGEQLVLRGGSRIATDVTVGAGNGGAIQIEPEVTILDESLITAGAQSGDGGSVDIRSQFLIVRPGSSEITASSRLGRDGVVEIASPESSLIRGLAPLESRIPTAADLLEPACGLRDAREGGSFVVRASRSLPAPPEDLLLAAVFPDLTPIDVAAVKSGRASHSAPSAWRGVEALRRGRFREARVRFEEASSHAIDADPQVEIWLGAGRASQELEEPEAARLALTRVLATARSTGDRALKARALSGLGSVSLTQGQLPLAGRLLEDAVSSARSTDDPAALASALLNLASQRTLIGELERAYALYQESAQAAGSAGLARARGFAGAARTALRLGRYEPARRMLDAVAAPLDPLPLSHDVLYTRIHAAETAAQLADHGDRDALVLRAHALLRAAGAQAEELGDARAASYAWGSLARLYHSERRHAEALTLARRALAWSDSVEDVEASYLWHWQLGRTLWAQGRSAPAIAQLRRSVEILEATRAGAPRASAPADSFRSRVAAVYLELVDALLRSAERLGGARGAALLLEARATMERLGAAELRDYFRDDCLDELRAREIPLELASKTTAVVYPILLPDRVELLVSHGTQVRRYSPDDSPSSAEVVDQARVLGALIQRGYGSSYLDSSQKLYDWLVRPYAEDLAASGVDTLVFVPDGALRAVPLAALHDGRDFLIRRFAIAVSPGLGVLDPRPLDRDDPEVLLAGLSERVRGRPPLAHVAQELDTIRDLYGGRRLLDGEFTSARVQESVESRAVSVIHVASHAAFSGDPDESFIATYDGDLSLEDFSALVRRTRFREVPVELLVLSACETARGDERAVLGLAGFALRSGARSALGSLFRIDDRATLELISEFYRQLRRPGRSRAEALRRAQLRLLDGADDLVHPSRWAPFLLLGSWL